MFSKILRISLEVMALWPTKTLVWKNNDDRQKKQNKFTTQAKRLKQSIAREEIEGNRC